VKVQRKGETYIHVLNIGTRETRKRGGGAGQASRERLLQDDLHKEGNHYGTNLEEKRGRRGDKESLGQTSGRGSSFPGGEKSSGNVRITQALCQVGGKWGTRQQEKRGGGKGGGSRKGNLSVLSSKYEWDRKG